MTTRGEYSVQPVSKLVELRQRVAELESLLGRQQQAGEVSKQHADQVALQMGAETAMVDRVCNIVTSTLDIKQVYEQFALELQKLVAFDRAYINLVDEVGDTFTLTYLFGQHVPGREIGAISPLSGSLTGEIVATGKTLIQPNMAADPNHHRGDSNYVRAGLFSGIVVPLVSKNRVIGILGLRSRQVAAFGAREQAILERLANQIAPALDNAGRYVESLREKERFSIALQNSDIILAHVDQELRYTWLHNPHPDLSPEMLLGKRDDELSSSDGYATLLKFKAEVLETCVADRREISFELSNGLRTFEIDVEPMRDASGKVIGLTLAAMDITEHNRVEALRAARDEAQTLSQRLVASQEAERRRIAQELHDEMGQLLTGVRLTLERSTRASTAAARTHLIGEAQNLVDELMARVRNLSLDLRPSMLDDLGLLPTLEWYIRRYTERTNIRVTFQPISLDQRLPPEVETAAYRICQEALTNIARHAGVDQAEVRLEIKGDTLVVQVNDSGAGFKPEDVSSLASSGLSGMRERVRVLGGQLILESSPGQGTRLTAELPLTISE
ncbi:MAG: GAF domain-containing protein [Chloroflexi bacterium]|nr:GAF domain-containing protein [Chloroflexota bacterium]